MRFIIVGLKRLEQEELDKLKGIEFKVLLKLKEENMQLKKKEFNHLYKDAKTNLARAIVDRKFSKLKRDKWPQIRKALKQTNKE